MKIISAGFSKTFPINQYYEKVWLEAELNDGEDERQVLYDLKKKVETFFFESTAASEKQKGTQVKDVEEIKEDSPIEAIGKCTTIEGVKGLKSFEVIAKSNAEIKIMYDLKMAQLSKKNKSKKTILP